jgi:hypothetical protein
MLGFKKTATEILITVTEIDILVVIKASYAPI